jgi:hypothetical protein
MNDEDQPLLHRFWAKLLKHAQKEQHANGAKGAYSFNVLPKSTALLAFDKNAVLVCLDTNNKLEAFCIQSVKKGQALLHSRQDSANELIYNTSIKQLVPEQQCGLLRCRDTELVGAAARWLVEDAKHELEQLLGTVNHAIPRQFDPFEL